MKSFTKNFSLLLVVVSVAMTSLIFTPTVSAQTSVSTQYDDIQSQGLIFAGICTSSTATCECRDNGNCTLQDILQVLVNLSVFILAISGSVMLFIFVYGGFFWLTSQGKTERVEKGRQAMVGALVGLVIIFGAYAAINIIISVLQTGTLPESGQSIEDTIGSEGVIKTE